MICRARRIAICSSRGLRSLWPLRSYSTPSTAERVTLRRPNGTAITLDVHQSFRGSSESIARSHVLIYLPRGPFLRNEEADASTVSTLSSNLNCPVVQINYRWSRDYRFPTPIHDVLAGYDWVLSHLLPKRGISRAGRPDVVGKIAVCGELIGGGLATALALTECRVGSAGVTAAAINSPLVDWVSFASEPVSAAVKRSKRSPTKQSHASSVLAEELRSLRKSLFTKPEHYFDTFASPTLLFRSAGVEVPAAPLGVPTDDMDYLSMLEREDFRTQSLSSTDTSSAPYDLDHLSQGEGGQQQRKASRRFPSRAAGLRLPSFNISSGQTSSLAGQAKELTQLLRQSHLRQIKNASSASDGFGRKVLLAEELDEMDEDEQHGRKLEIAQAEDRVHATLYEGSGLWDNSSDGQAKIVKVAKWLESKLD